MKSALSFSAIESIGSRIFDFIVLWVVLNRLPKEDIALFGLATSSIFFFNLLFFAPETALLRYQKKWASDNELRGYLSAFVSFSFAKLIFHVVLVLFAVWWFGVNHWVFYAIVFSGITQQIQLAEIARIYMRMELEQKYVAKFELFSKFILCVACLFLLSPGGIDKYFLIYFFWSVVVSIFWVFRLNARVSLEKISVSKSVDLIWRASAGFSLWSHFSGVLTYYIYNSNILYLELFGIQKEDLALYTIVSKVANLFFVIPMFLQSFVPIVLSGVGADVESNFRKILLGNVAFSVGQFLLFAVFGLWMAPFFGLKDEVGKWNFYYYGAIINFGIMALNLTRPLSTYLLIRSQPRRVMLLVFVPASIVASVLYITGAYYGGMLGSAIGSALAYIFMGLSLIVMYKGHKNKSVTSYEVKS